MTLSEEISAIIKIHVPKGKYRQAYKNLNFSGVISTKQKDEMLFLLLERVELLEDRKLNITEALNTYFGSLIEDTKSHLTSNKAVSEPPTTSLERTWTDVRHEAKELGVFKVGTSREELEALIASKKTV